MTGLLYLLGLGLICWALRGNRPGDADV